MDGRPQSPTSEAAAAPIKPAIILGKYQLDKLLGKGSFAKVYRAYSIADGTPVAIKIINRPKPSLADLITREVSAMQRLKHHPNILKIHEVMATKTKIYLVMELAEGGDLHSKIARRGRFTESAARKYFQQLVSALRFCHHHGVSHRDMKPQNLLLDCEGNLKIADFGLSALPEQLSDDGVLKTACGTPAYTAPEVFCRPRGFTGYDGAKADSWSCGVILYVLLSGVLPFDDSNFSKMYKKMYQRDYDLPTWISRPAKSIISQLLEPNPNARLSIEDLMRFSWFKKSQPQLHSQVSLFKSESETCCKLQKVGSMNAFDIISMSSGLDLSGLFENSKKNEKRFTTWAKADAIEDRLSEIGVKMGFMVEKWKNGAIGLWKGRVILIVEVKEVTESVFLVDVKAVEGGDEFEKIHWHGLKTELGDFVISWHNDAI